MMTDLELWYDAPAARWTEALPVGNGRLGAMVFGGIAAERLQLNEDTLWAGGPYSPANPEAREHVDEVRRLIFAGRYAEAEALANRHLMARPLKQMPYQPAGDLAVAQRFSGEATAYRRSLDLDTAVQTTTFTAGGVTYTREVFASAADGVIVCRLSAGRPASITLDLSLTSDQHGEASPATGTEIGWRGVNRDAEGIAGRLKLKLRARVAASGGTTTPAGTSL
jgi:alpha-L-fucosidase 2